MRWIFLLLLVLNVFYYVWHQQQAPMRGIEVAPLEQYRVQQKDIRLLSESPGEIAPKSAEVSPATLNETCMYLGSFDSIEEAETLRQRLAGLNIESVAQQEEAESGQDYWVYLPPLASRDASLRQLKELQARQIDSFLIAEGDLENGISLGIFPRRESAISVMERLVAAGYEPAMRELLRDQRSYWIRVSPDSSRLLDGVLLGVLSVDFKDLRHDMKLCEPVAMPRQFE